MTKYHIVTSYLVMTQKVVIQVLISYLIRQEYDKGPILPEIVPRINISRAVKM